MSRTEEQLKTMLYARIADITLGDQNSVPLKLNSRLRLLGLSQEGLFHTPPECVDSIRHRLEGRPEFQGNDGPEVLFRTPEDTSPQSVHMMPVHDGLFDSRPEIRSLVFREICRLFPDPYLRVSLPRSMRIQEGIAADDEKVWRTSAAELNTYLERDFVFGLISLRQACQLGFQDQANTFINQVCLSQQFGSALTALAVHAFKCMVANGTQPASVPSAKPDFRASIKGLFERPAGDGYFINQSPALNPRLEGSVADGLATIRSHFAGSTDLQTVLCHAIAVASALGGASAVDTGQIVEALGNGVFANPPGERVSSRIHRIEQIVNHFIHYVDASCPSMNREIALKIIYEASSFMEAQLLVAMPDFDETFDQVMDKLQEVTSLSSKIVRTTNPLVATWHLHYGLRFPGRVACAVEIVMNLDVAHLNALSAVQRSTVAACVQETMACLFMWGQLFAPSSVDPIIERCSAIAETLRDDTLVELCRNLRDYRADAMAKQTVLDNYKSVAESDAIQKLVALQAVKGQIAAGTLQASELETLWNDTQWRRGVFTNGGDSSLELFCLGYLDIADQIGREKVIDFGHLLISDLEALTLGEDRTYELLFLIFISSVRTGSDSAIARLVSSREYGRYREATEQIMRIFGSRNHVLPEWLAGRIRQLKVFVDAPLSLAE